MSFCRPLALCPSHHLSSPSTPNPLPAPSQSPSPLATFRPGIPVLFLALTITFLLTFILLLYAKHCKRSAHLSDDRTNYYPTGFTPPRNSGMARAVVESLPAFRFSALKGRQKERLECAVCLAGFGPAEVLRLLPKCQHAFHLECVDIWLDAHSTCPLCRSRVDPEDVLLLPDSSGRRVSGRHSSAGENYTLPAVSNTKQQTRLSADAAVAVERVRKDAHLLGNVECGHRIVVQERWSDIIPSDLLYLRSEMIIDGGGESLRCLSEITGVSRNPKRSRRLMGPRMNDHDRKVTL